MAALALPSAAQDLRTVTSPDGNLELRVFLGQQEDTALFRLAYQVFLKGKKVVDPSYLGFDIWEQEPLLGENVGLVTATTESHQGYNTFLGRYLQNGSLGRAFILEARVFNDGVAFRYHLLKSMPMADLFISDETTEFAIGVPVPEQAELPFRIELPGVAWLEISEIPLAGFPKMSLGHSAKTVLVSRLTTIPGNHGYLFHGSTPLIGPWRILGITPTPGTLSADTWRTRLSQ